MLRFCDLSQQAILPDSFGSAPELVEALMKYLARHSLTPKRYMWRLATGDSLFSLDNLKPREV
jgi:hypothetical protein